MWGNVGFLHTNVWFWHSKCPIVWKNFSLQFDCNPKQCEVYLWFSVFYVNETLWNTKIIQAYNKTANKYKEIKSAESGLKS